MKYRPDYTLYLVTDRTIIGNRDLERCVEEAIQGGVTLIQLREKTASSLEFYNIAHKVKAVTDHYQIPLIINDRLDIAMAVNATGVHLGQSDLPAKVARQLLGADKLVGVSTSTVEEALLAEQAGADYIGVGAIFPTETKSNTRKVTLENLSIIKKSLKIPVVAIGGIHQENVVQILNTGIDGIAVVSAILGEENIEKTTRELHKQMTKSI